MWQDYRRGGWRGWLLPLALIATVAEQIHLLNSDPVWSQRLTPILIVLCILAVGVLLIARIAPRYRLKAPGVRFILPALGVVMLALMLAPTVWAAIPVTQGTTSGSPGSGTAVRAMASAATLRRWERYDCQHGSGSDYAIWRPIRARRNFWSPYPAQ